MAEVVKRDVRDDILAHLDNDDRSMVWLSEKTGINYNTLYSILKQRLIKLSAERLKLINDVLGTKFKRQYSQSKLPKHTQ